MLVYGIDRLAKLLKPSHKQGKQHVFFCICDHFEPLVGNADHGTGYKRVEQWRNAFPKLAQRYRDSDGCIPKYTFFYPAEEYQRTHAEMLGDICNQGCGEVEIHLHHHNDTAENFRKTILDFKSVLFKEHGFLSLDKETNEIAYGFIHGNWALDNARKDGCMCGLNNELTILRETGCYADFTLPSAPDSTQTRKINSIYYSIDDPKQPKSHDSGIDAVAGRQMNDGLLMVQGPLLFNFRSRKWGIVPRIENGEICHDNTLNNARIELWLQAGITVKGREDCIFIKVHTHGCYPPNAHYLLGGGLDSLFESLQGLCSKASDTSLHYLSAREMANIIKAMEAKRDAGDIMEMKNFRYQQRHK